MNRYIVYKSLMAAAILVGFTLTGCKKYLEVFPKSSVSEDQIFNSQIGFQQALTGIYSLVSSRSLYGDNLTMGFTSALAQNYAPVSTNSYFYYTRRYDYSSDEVRNFLSIIWSTSYNAIAGANNIIEHTQSNRAVLTDSKYNEIRGEALALRALMHFDLLRIFGPSFSAGPDQKAIPYKTTLDQLSKIPSTVQEVTDLTLKDLDEAAGLLRHTDPIIGGTMNRQIKMNYYAVKALQARVLLYRGDKSLAYDAARAVVTPGLFPFVLGENINTAYGMDYLFKSELIFGLRVRNIKDWAVDLYFGSYRSDIGVPNLTLSQYQTLYETSGVGVFDSRWNFLLKSPANAPSSVRTTTKYLQTWTQSSTDDRLDQLVPVIRISEMYYILAETAPTLDESVAWLNKVREGRNIDPLSGNLVNQQTFEQELTKEYQKEFYAEGQLFFYYKRKNATSIQFLKGPFSVGNYVLPVPDGELEVNPNY